MKNLLGCVMMCWLSAGAALAGDTWTSIDGQSSVAFGSIKKNVVGEVHHFTAVNGTVDTAGTVTINIDLTSVETNIDIRNERLGEYVFHDAALATLTGQVDMDSVSKLAVGETTLADFDGTLTLGSAEVSVQSEMFVARLAEDRVLVSTADFIMLPTSKLGIDKGLDKLTKLAKLSGITRVTPVAIRMVFTK